MMPSKIVLCLATLAVTAAAVEKSGVGSIHALEEAPDQRGSIVRRMKKKFDADHKVVSAFAGMTRSDHYSVHSGKDCSVADILDNDATMPEQTTAEQCQQSCIADDDCTCVTHDVTKGTCKKQRRCYEESCKPSSLLDTYILHSTFKLQKKGNLSSASILQVVADPLPASTEQTLYERSGGRACTNGTTDITGGCSGADCSVTQCLGLCQSTVGCDCVMYERYYSSKCYLKNSCPAPGEVFCDRSEIYDMYVLK
jgi:hypothetical protein